jgi:oxygen-dependent protoporphyrinogen oxidase
MRYDHIYAIATPERSFNMMFNTANLLRLSKREAGGTLMVYSGATAARKLEAVTDDEIASLYAADLTAMFPELRNQIEEVHIKRWARGLPYPVPGRGGMQCELDRDLGRLHLAGDYLGTRYVETAIQSGIDAAESIRRKMRAAGISGEPDVDQQAVSS